MRMITEEAAKEDGNGMEVLDGRRDPSPKTWQNKMRSVCFFFLIALGDVVATGCEGSAQGGDSNQSDVNGTFQ